jgi:cytochrome c553
LALVTALAGFAAPAAGSMIDSPPRPWETCATCHSLDGNSAMPRFPKLAAQPEAYIVKQIEDFRSGRRGNDGGQMAAVVSELTPDEIEGIAAYFASLPSPPSEPGAEPGPDIRELALNACMSCHAADRAEETGAPRLEAQHPAYIEKQLLDFREGRRGNDADGAMRAAASGLTPEEISGLAAWLGASERD